MSRYEFFNELLNYIEELQKTLDKMRDVLKAQIKETQK